MLSFFSLILIVPYPYLDRYSFPCPYTLISPQVMSSATGQTMSVDAVRLSNCHSIVLKRPTATFRVLSNVTTQQAALMDALSKEVRELREELAGVRDARETELRSVCAAC